MSEVDLTPFAGVWRNTADVARWISRVDTRIEGRTLVTRISGGVSSPASWGEARTEDVYAAGPDSRQGCAFVTRHRIGDEVVEVEANVNQGLMIVATLVRGGDGNNTFTREFFFRSES